jgi:hypothetical protein
MKIYISGKISGLSIEEYTANFNNTEKYLENLYSRFNVKIVNPLNINPFLGIKTWHGYMINDVRALLKCDAIYIMDNWSESRGAKIELAIALLTKKKILCG